MFVRLTAQDVRWGKSHVQQCHGAVMTTAVTNAISFALTDVFIRALCVAPFGLGLTHT